MVIYLPPQGSRYILCNKFTQTLIYMHHCVQISLPRGIEIQILAFVPLCWTDRLWTTSIRYLAYPLRPWDLLSLYNTQYFLVMSSLSIISWIKTSTKLQIPNPLSSAERVQPALGTGPLGIGQVIAPLAHNFGTGRFLWPGTRNSSPHFSYLT